LNIIRSPREWLEMWDRVYVKYGSVKIDLFGAEPTLYPDFIWLITLLVRKHQINFTTNLSWNKETFNRFIEHVDPSKIRIMSSFHPYTAKFNEFLDKLLILRRSGFFNGSVYTQVCCVAWPPILKNLKKIKEKFESSGFLFRTQPFEGIYKNIKYPEGYTQEDRDIILELQSKELSDVDKQMPKFQLREVNPKGKLCYAGERHAYIEPKTGDIYRCVHDRSTMLGNFFKGNFNLLDKPLPCNSTYCNCNFINLLE
jgi:sulfatase maturation enzyme AslB (radical SAM superfamily)